jgi:CheY-like chemotaxis protein
MASYHILIVEDQLDVRRVLRSGLESLGKDFVIVDVPSGEEALLVSARQRIDLLVADIRLAGMSGLELQQIMRRRYNGVKVILITGLTDPEIRAEIVASGADALFFKPVDMVEFLATVEGCLGLEEDVPYGGEYEPEAVQENSLAKVLSGLRQDLKAESVVLMDDNGHTLAQAGDLPDVITQPHLTPSLMAAFSASAQVSQDLGMRAPQDLLCFSGLEHDLYMTHVGGAFALLIVGDPGKSGDTRELALSSLRPAVNDLLDVLTTLGVPLQPLGEERSTPPVMVEKVVDDTERPDLVKVFKKASRRKFDPGEVDAFWENAVHQSSSETPPDTGELSYEQARRLGFAPGEQS